MFYHEFQLKPKYHKTILYYENNFGEIHTIEFDDLPTGKHSYEMLDKKVKGVKGKILILHRKIYQKYSGGKNASIQNCLKKAKDDGNLKFIKEDRDLEPRIAEENNKMQSAL